MQLHEVLPLRTAVFRPLLQGIEFYEIEKDREDSTRHFGVETDDDEVVGVATVLEDPCPKLPDRPGRRIFGFAIEEQYRGRGVGWKLFELLWRRTLEEFPQCEVVWGNALVSSCEFWELGGFKLITEPFEIEGRGMHRIAAQLVEDGRAIEELVEMPDS